MKPLSEGVEKLIQATWLDRAGLVAALYELAQHHQIEIRNYIEDGPGDRAVERIARALDGLFSNDGDPWKMSPEFWRELAKHRGDPPGLVYAAIVAVTHALRQTAGRKPPPRLVQSLFHDESFWIAIQPGDCHVPWHEERVASSLASLDWFKGVRVIPERVGGKRLRVTRLDPRLAKHLQATTNEAGALYPLRIAVSPISPHIEHRIGLPAEPAPVGGHSYARYHFEELEDVDRWADLLAEQILPACEQKDAAILILPELTVSRSLRDRLSKCLAERDARRCREETPRSPRPVLVVAGSYHEPDRNGKYVNRCVVLDHRGAPAAIAPAWDTTEDDSDEPADFEWDHVKVDKFILAGYAVEKAKGIPPEGKAELLAALGMDGRDVAGGSEPEQLGDRFTLVDTPAGRMCVAICIDYLKSVSKWTNELQSSWVDWLLIPSASPETRHYAPVAAELAMHGSATVATNACWLLHLFSQWKDQWAGLAHLPFGGDGRWLIEPASAKTRQVPPEKDSGAGPCCQAFGGVCLWVFEAGESAAGATKLLDSGPPR